MINVTRPFLPPLEEYNAYTASIWERVWLTNNGPLVNQLEASLKQYLGMDHLLFLSNGTIALQIAIKALDLTGEIITTPFSYVATTSSIVWENCIPVFVDIDRNSLNINPALIEAAITEKTSAILATHVFGNPCDIDAIAQIARKHNLKVIYDAAHCFGTTYKGKSVFNYGDISTTSFHATKLFHTTEGGAVFTPSAQLHNKMAQLRNFGHITPETFGVAGINGKNSEFHAAMGLCNLKYIDDILADRKRVVDAYLQQLEGLNLTTIQTTPDSGFNYAYMPVVFENNAITMKVIKAMNEKDIYPRRYFYPCLSTLNYVNKYDTPVSMDISQRIICLPVYHAIPQEIIEQVCSIIEETIS